MINDMLARRLSQKAALNQFNSSLKIMKRKLLKT